MVCGPRQPVCSPATRPNCAEKHRSDPTLDRRSSVPRGTGAMRTKRKKQADAERAAQAKRRRQAQAHDEQCRNRGLRERNR